MPVQTPESWSTWLFKAGVQSIVLAVIASLITYFGTPLIAARLEKPTCANPGNLQLLTPKSALNQPNQEEKPDKLITGETLLYNASATVDGDTGTGWASNGVNLGRGQTLTYAFSSQAEVDMLCIVDGYARSWRLYEENPRVRKVGVSGGSTTLTATLEDLGTAEHVAIFQKIDIPDGITGTIVTLTVESVYAGVYVDPVSGVTAATSKPRFPNTAISEIEFWGH